MRRAMSEALPLAALTSASNSSSCADATAANAVDAKEESEDGRGVCLVLGAEGRGLSAEALGGCQPVKVPMPGEMESLNVGIAGGILMYVMRK